MRARGTLGSSQGQPWVRAALPSASEPPPQALAPPCQAQWAGLLVPALPPRPWHLSSQGPLVHLLPHPTPHPGRELMAYPDNSIHTKCLWLSRDCSQGRFPFKCWLLDLALTPRTQSFMDIYFPGRMRWKRGLRVSLKMHFEVTRSYRGRSFLWADGQVQLAPLPGGSAGQRAPRRLGHGWSSVGAGGTSVILNANIISC